MTRTITSALLAAASLAFVLVPWPFTPMPPLSDVVSIRASQFAFEPEQVEVVAGQEVVLELTSLDVVHGLYLDGYNLQLSADPGETSRVTFVADRTGSFRFRCSIACGQLHPFMIGVLRVEPDGKLVRILAASGLALAAGVVWSKRVGKTD